LKINPLILLSYVRTLEAIHLKLIRLGSFNQNKGTSHFVWHWLPPSHFSSRTKTTCIS